MTHYQRELQRIAASINETKKLRFELRVIRRKNYYAVDKYDKEQRYFGPSFFGNFRETRNYLIGMKNAIYLM